MASNLTLTQLRETIRKRVAPDTQKVYAQRKGYSAQYLCDFLLGRRDPGDKLLEAEGFERIVTYRRTK